MQHIFLAFSLAVICKYEPVCEGCYTPPCSKRFCDTHCTHINTNARTHTYTIIRIQTPLIEQQWQRSDLIYSAESSPWSVMRASGIIKFGPAASSRLVGWLTLSCWLVAMTDCACGARPVCRLIDYTARLQGNLASWLQACLTDWLGDWLISCWFAGVRMSK